MAQNNFTPISYGALASTDNVNRPLEQLSDAIDLVRTTAAADVAQAEADIEAAAQHVKDNYVKLPLNALWTTTQVLVDGYYWMYIQDNNPAYKEAFEDGDMLLVRITDSVRKEASKPVKICDKNNENVLYTGLLLGTPTAKPEARLLYRYDGTNWVFYNMTGSGNDDENLWQTVNKKTTLPIFAICDTDAGNYQIDIDTSSYTAKSSIAADDVLLVKFTYAHSASRHTVYLRYNGTTIRTSTVSVPANTAGGVIMFYYDGTDLHFVAALS